MANLFKILIHTMNTLIPERIRSKSSLWMKSLSFLVLMFSLLGAPFFLLVWSLSHLSGAFVYLAALILSAGLGSYYLFILKVLFGINSGDALNKAFKILVTLKPFDETRDEKIAGSIYASSTLLTLGILISSAFLFIGLISAIINSSYAPHALAVFICVSAITSGIEWMHGLKGRAKNQLFLCAFASAAMYAINSLS